MSDLFRAHEGNQDFREEHPTEIHWAKFNMLGGFIGSTAQYQTQCRVSSDYDYPKNRIVNELLHIPPMEFVVCKGIAIIYQAPDW